MSRPWQVWMLFAAGLALVLAAMGWISLIAFRLERSEHQARCNAVLEENVQLALWRMEAALAPMIAEENGRPYVAYRSFFDPGQAYARYLDGAVSSETLVPSPLLTGRPANTLVHFQIDPQDRLSSPQVPAEELRKPAESKYLAAEVVASSAAELEELKSLLDVPKLRELLCRPFLTLGPDAPIERSDTQLDEVFGQMMAEQSQMKQARQRGPTEQRARFQQAASNVVVPAAPLTDDRKAVGSPIRALWMNGALMLARRVQTDGGEYVQGCRLDWPAIELRLKEKIADLLPDADLEPVQAETPSAETRMLAALPVRLVPGGLPAAVEQRLSVIRVSLVVAWIGVLVGALAIAALLGGAVSLSERRATFVSAVTHELRTPLTTLGMYTDMLQKGMVPGEEKRRHYLATMQTEVRRLTHMVSNVLAFARLERTKPRQTAERTALIELVHRLQDRFAARAGLADMQFAVDVEPAALDRRVMADPDLVEQILFNLVDNACKYAGGGENPVIHWEISATRRTVVMRIRDHGPGIPDSELRRIFRAFSKSAKDAAHSAPGVGLGLSLARRLARSVGGDLQLDPRCREGACFVLTLPAA